jgi:hypothetical protein
MIGKFKIWQAWWHKRRPETAGRQVAPRGARARVREWPRRPCVCCGDYCEVRPNKLPVCDDCREIAGWSE